MEGGHALVGGRRAHVVQQLEPGLLPPGHREQAVGKGDSYTTKDKFSSSGSGAILEGPIYPTAGGGGGVEIICVNFEFRGLLQYSMSSLICLASEEQVSKQLKQVSIVGHYRSKL